MASGRAELSPLQGEARWEESEIRKERVEWGWWAFDREVTRLLNFHSLQESLKQFLLVRQLWPNNPCSFIEETNPQDT